MTRFTAARIAKSAKRIAVLTLAVLAGGCAAPNFNVDSISIDPAAAGDVQELWQQHRANVAAISAWNVKGIMAVRTDAQRGNVSLTWDYQPARQKIELYGPFGSGRVQIIADENEAVLQTTRGESVRGADAADVLYAQLGWQVPFAQLQFWVRGIPAHARTSEISVDRAGRLKTLQQDNWRIEYADYAVHDGITLPRTMTLTAERGSLAVFDRDGIYVGDNLEIKVVLKRWRNIRFD